MKKFIKVGVETTVFITPLFTFEEEEYHFPSYAKAKAFVDKQAETRGNGSCSPIMQITIYADMIASPN